MSKQNYHAFRDLYWHYLWLRALPIPYPIKQGPKDTDTTDFSISLGKKGKINKLIVERGISSSECFFLADMISYCNKGKEHVSLIKFQQDVSPWLERMVLFCLAFSLGRTQEMRHPLPQRRWEVLHHIILGFHSRWDSGHLPVTWQPITLACGLLYLVRNLILGLRTNCS